MQRIHFSDKIIIVGIKLVKCKNDGPKPKLHHHIKTRSIQRYLITEICATIVTRWTSLQAAAITQWIGAILNWFQGTQRATCHHICTIRTHKSLEASQRRLKKSKILCRQLMHSQCMIQRLYNRMGRIIKLMKFLNRRSLISGIIKSNRWEPVRPR